MRKNRSLIFLVLLIFFLVSLSRPTPDKIRELAVRFLSPILGKTPTLIEPNSAGQEEFHSLLLENHRLLLELNLLHERMEQEINLKKNNIVNAIAAQVIFRSPASWNSSLWINVGEDDNHGKNLIAKNSPVLVGSSILGVVEYVGKHQSRVRLITDSGLTPSVRAIRKDAKNTTCYLAKGELQGSGKPLWRSEGTLLHGIGFNYDFADEYGPARDLQNGIPLSPSQNIATMAILAPGDLLITTGMDAVFPPGYPVATVTKIYPLQEGDYYYELEAIPTAGNLDDLSFVFVIPPYCQTDQQVELERKVQINQKNH